MIDTFVILTPILLLAVIAIFAFVGCSFQHGSEATTGTISVAPASGLSFGGTTITITGENCGFVTINQVTFSDGSGFSATATSITQPQNTMNPGEQVFTCVTPAYTGMLTAAGASVTVAVGYVNTGNYPSTVQSSFIYFPPVTHVQTVAAGATGGKTITAAPLNLQGGELIIATLQWSDAGNPMPTISGATLQPVPSGGIFTWNAMSVQSFYGMNSVNGQVTISVTLSASSTTPWSLCVSAYDFADTANPIYSPEQGNSNYVGANPSASAIAANEGDLIHAVVYGADNGGPFPGASSLSPGTNFVAESGPVTFSSSVMNPLVEGAQAQASSSITPQANNSVANARGFIVAIGIKAANG